MKYLFYLSGEDLGLAEREVLRLAESYGRVKGWERDARYLILEYEGLEFFTRLAYTHEVSELHSILDECLQALREIRIPKGRGCVRVVGKVENKLKLERELGAILWKRGAEISVSNPDWICRVYLGRRCYVGLLKWVRDRKQFLIRRPDNRPFLMPSAIKPKLARALVNLTGAKDRLLDPMCGTGSILIEAGLMGIQPVGVEFFDRIARGCLKNLRFYKICGDVIVGDARSLPFKNGSFDGVATDYPYLKSTKSPADLEDLYQKSSEEIRRVLKDGCYAAVVTNIDAESYFKDFTVESKFYQRVHGSLTRRIYLLKGR